MAWWTRATDRPNREQSWIQEEFSHLWENSDGTIGEAEMREFLEAIS